MLHAGSYESESTIITAVQKILFFFRRTRETMQFNNVATLSLKPVLNWVNVCSPEHTSDTSTNYDSFLN